MLLSKGFFWTAIEVMNPWTSGDVLCYLLPSSGSFGRFGSSFPWMILLWGRKKETTTIRAFQFKAAHVLCILTPFSHKQQHIQISTFTHSSLSTGLDSLCPPHVHQRALVPHNPSVPSLDHLWLMQTAAHLVQLGLVAEFIWISCAVVLWMICV